jgi:NADH:ubiquinone oxidoreductase subunit 5 (subunit L)/multisubunit Na+/H+ antiporter MnhA subunit
MDAIINIFLAIPCIGFVASLLVPKAQEKTLSQIAFLTAGANLAGFLLFAIVWLWNGAQVMNVKEIVLYRTDGYEFFVDVYFDTVTAVYMLVGSFLTFIITMYSRTYLHREQGYKRFFNTILLFYFGYTLTICSGNFETLFIGWEILGLSSFLLIAFYRDRYLPARNAVKVFSIYRIGDVGILLAMWASHHLWHENITFLKLNNYTLVHEHLQSHSAVGAFIALMILVAAAAKSAQLPFSSWLPRAMEGPTPSSAIFYGSLSVHIGVFLLLRTYPFWEHQSSVRVLFGLLGLSTAVIASMIARVQSSIKSQIGYASIAQIGIIFIEIALGFKALALAHFASNAFLRTYQLLVSPSVVSYLIREQFYHFVPHEHTVEDRLPKRLEYGFYMLSLKEWNLDTMMSYRLFGVFRKAGHTLDFLTLKNVILWILPLYVIALTLLFLQHLIPSYIIPYLPVLFSILGLGMVLKAFSERSSPLLCWLLIIMYHSWIALAVAFNEQFGAKDVAMYLSGVGFMGILGFIGLRRLQREEEPYFSLDRYFGHIYEHPRFGMVVLLACLGVMGFPITPTFIGEDLVFSHIREEQFLLAFFNALGFVIGGIAAIRLYARLFLGSHVKTYHAVPYKSA